MAVSTGPIAMLGATPNSTSTKTRITECRPLRPLRVGQVLEVRVVATAPQKICFATRST